MSVGRIAIADYDATWPAQFENEAAALRGVLGPRAFRIDHVGSTSVPGLPAKPIIDMLLVVADSSDESSYVPRLDAAGYVLRIREPGWYEHRMFNGPRTPVNVHVFSSGCPEIERMLTFRDRLRQNADDRAIYVQLKRELSQHDWASVDDYANAKHAVVARILASAGAPIDLELAHQLLREQHADLSELPLSESYAGVDNTCFRLGDRLALRFPRRATSAALIENEQRWLPGLSAELPLPIPAPLRIGRPTARFQWPWSVVPWFEGNTALSAVVEDTESLAHALGSFLHALHRPAPADAPVNPWRGIDLTGRTELLHRDVKRLGDEIDGEAVLALWPQVLAARPWQAARLWIHGDLHPGNLLVDNGRLSAVLDFGDLTAGDPATDLSVAWMLLPHRHRAALRGAARSPWNPIDDDTWLRARGWALALGVSYLANFRGDPIVEVGKATIAAALTHDL
ncbi:MAG TPA: GrpB family protein [Vicinamibacterales bacterium]|nr:GrpB family protein [Vicinamibacterales bacterium]